MVKSNTPSRDMRALERELRKTKCELVQTKQNAATFSKMVHRARDKALVSFSCIHKKNKNLEKENQILLRSLKNFNVTCNKQKKRLCKQSYSIQILQKLAKELMLTKKGLENVQNTRNPHLIRTVNI